MLQNPSKKAFKELKKAARKALKAICYPNNKLKQVMNTPKSVGMFNIQINHHNGLVCKNYGLKCSIAVFLKSSLIR